MGVPPIRSRIEAAGTGGTSEVVIKALVQGGYPQPRAYEPYPLTLMTQAPARPIQPKPGERDADPEQR